MPRSGKEGNGYRHSNLRLKEIFTHNEDDRLHTETTRAKKGKDDEYSKEDNIHYIQKEDSNKGYTEEVEEYSIKDHYTKKKNSNNTKFTKEKTSIDPKIVMACWEKADEYVNQIIKAQDAAIDHNTNASDRELKEKASKRNFYHKAEAQIRPDICYSSEQPSEQANDYSDSILKEEIDSSSDQDTTACPSDQSTDNSLSYSQVFSEIYEESITRQQRADKLCRAYNLSKSPHYAEYRSYRTDEESEASTFRSLSSECFSDVAHNPEEADDQATDVLNYDSIKAKFVTSLETFYNPEHEEQQAGPEEETTATNSSVDSECSSVSGNISQDSDDQSSGELDYDALIQEQLRIISEYENKDALDSRDQLTDQEEILEAESSDREMTDRTYSDSSTSSTISLASVRRDYLCGSTGHHHYHHHRRQRRLESVPKAYRDRGSSPINIKTARFRPMSETVDSQNEKSTDSFSTKSIASIAIQYPSDDEQKDPKTSRSCLGVSLYNADEALVELADFNCPLVMGESSDYLDLSISDDEDHITSKLLAAALTSRSKSRSTSARSTPKDDHESIMSCRPRVAFKRRSETEEGHCRKNRLYRIAEGILSASLQRYQHMTVEYEMASGDDDDDPLHFDISCKIQTLEFNKKFQHQLHSLKEIFQ
ncbi:GL22215 [Drosophila persimilis]|uniref:GL22215 n=1 Tax=Drosophila persimilis TaxID=7234 RepID=B4GFH9_DROPE|nr:GL22215 [Drosophila persimilis]